MQGLYALQQRKELEAQLEQLQNHLHTKAVAAAELFYSLETQNKDTLIWTIMAAFDQGVPHGRKETEESQSPAA